MTPVSIRPAAPRDAAAVCAIYNEGIEGRQATFETRLRAPEEVVGWLEDALPFLVAVDGEDGEVLGFARLTRYSDRCVYSGVGDHGVYVSSRARGRGVGRRLLDALCDQAAREGYYKVTSRIFKENAASRAAHRAAGFVEVGIQRHHGQLDGKWLDCVLVERLIGDAAQ